jgi:hypothetical protein
MDAEKIIAQLFERHVRGLAEFDPSCVHVERGTSAMFLQLTSTKVFPFSTTTALRNTAETLTVS